MWRPSRLGRKGEEPLIGFADWGLELFFSFMAESGTVDLPPPWGIPSLANLGPRFGGAHFLRADECYNDRPAYLVPTQTDEFTGNGGLPRLLSPATCPWRIRKFPQNGATRAVLWVLTSTSCYRQGR
jgi:hypothetical protein